MFVPTVVIAVLALLQVFQFGLMCVLLYVAARWLKVPNVSLQRAAAITLVVCFIKVATFVVILTAAALFPFEGFINAPPRAMMWPLVGLLGLLVGNIAAVWIVLARMLPATVVRAALAGLIMFVPGVFVSQVLAVGLKNSLLEAFQVGAGSMAPTFLGRHKEVDCPACGYDFDLNASEEMAGYGGSRVTPVVSGVCPVCRWTMSLAPNQWHGKTFPSYAGDRVLADKVRYWLLEPERWDLVIFKYPEDPRINYVKRMVGLPNEDVRITQGDVFIRGIDDEDFTIARKQPEQVVAALELVHNNDSQTQRARTTDQEWPDRWSAWPKEDTATGAWTAVDGEGSFENPGTASGESWLRYQHLLPLHQGWWQHDNSGSGEVPGRPQLITDFIAYNTALVDWQKDGQRQWAPLGLHWVGDLALECELSARARRGEAVLELVEATRRFQCRIDLEDGTATLLILSDADETESLAEAATNLGDGSSHTIRFANCDDELFLWIDDFAVEFAEPTTFTSRASREVLRPTRADLSPVGIASVGAKLSVNHLRVYRDRYYLAVDASTEMVGRFQDIICDFDAAEFIPTERRFNAPESKWKPLFGELTPDRHAEVFSNPEHWDAYQQALRTDIEFHLEDRQYFVLGDNSPRSKDGRLWYQQHWVDRSQLIGKAAYIYWPPRRWGQVR